MPEQKLILIDASAVIHRAFHALPILTTRDGRVVNAVYGFCLILLKIINEIKPTYLAVAFDSPKPTFRHREFPDYKAKRIKKGEELYSQFPLIRKVLAAFRIPIYEKEGYEADDVIATAVAKLKTKAESIIVTGDLDALQLVDKNIKVYAMRKGLTDFVVYDENKVLEKYGFPSAGLVDFKGLAGDSSDNIPGVPGIGEKTAGELIKKYGNIKGVYQNLGDHRENVRHLLEAGRKSAFLSRKLTVLVADLAIKVNLSECQYGGYDVDKVAALFQELDFKSLVSRLPGVSKTQMPLFEKEAETPAAQIDQEVEPVLREIEKTGVKIDLPYLEELSQKANRQINSLKTEIFQKAGGEFNLDSPRQLSQILFVRLGIEVKGVKKTKTGISTAASELLKLKNTHPVVGLILKYRELAKLKNTYLDPLPGMVDKNFRLHTTYAQDTQTGRLSSRNPNLQNIPIKTETGREIRKAFIAEDGYKLLAADYSQIELRIIAHYSKDPQMLKIFQEGGDIHQMVCDRLKIVRHVAKTINFGIIYGMSAHGLSETLGISCDLAQNYIDRFFDLYPRLKLYLEECIGEARQKGHLETLFGRRRYLPEINSPIFKIRLAAERMAVNFPAQGTAADILKLAMTRLYSKLKSFSSRLILTVHDELVFEVPDKKVREAGKTIKKTMENVVKLEVPLVVEISAGNNWGELEKIKS